MSWGGVFFWLFIFFFQGDSVGMDGMGFCFGNGVYEGILGKRYGIGIGIGLVWVCNVMMYDRYPLLRGGCAHDGMNGWDWRAGIWYGI